MADDPNADVTITLTVAEWTRLARAAEDYQRRDMFVAAMVRQALPCPPCGQVPVRGQDSTVYGVQTDGRTWHVRCWVRSTLPAHIAAILPD